MSHTPGPWRISEYAQIWPEDSDDSIDDKNIVWRIGGANGESVCGTCDGCDAITGADARLIAAAPELLSALEAVVAAYDSAFTSPNFRPPPHEVMARAAIAKARGL